MMKKIYVSVAFLLSGYTLYAQFGDNYLKAADNYYTNGDYSSASNYYEKYLTAGNSKESGHYDPYNAEALARKTSNAKSAGHLQAVYKLAESYRQLTHYAKAAPYYKEVVETDKQAFPLARFYYASVLKKLEQYKEAETTLQSFLQEYTADDAYARTAKQELQSLRFIQEQLQKADVKLYTVSKAAINSEGATYAPVWLDNNTVLFTSTRADNAAAKNTVHINRIYETALPAGAVTKTNLPQVEGGHQGVVSVSADGNRMFITRWTVKAGKKTAGIYRSERSATGWSAPELLEPSVNAPGANNQQPFVSADGAWLWFASDRTGGAGGYDLWYVPLDGSGHAGAAQNAGSVINTAADEQAPYYHAPSATLVFTSNGRVGMGGYDLYSSKGTPGQWSEPKNMGYPVNSVKDDMYFVSKSHNKNLLSDVFVSSDRSSACCLEVLALQKQQPAKQVAGQVVDCSNGSPLAGARVVVLDTVSGKMVYSQAADAQGRYSFTIPAFVPLKVTANAAQYKPGQLSVAAPADEEALSLNNPALCLQHEPLPEVGEVEVMHYMYFELNSAAILDSSKPTLDELAKTLLDNPAVTIEISGHTDNVGTKAYNQKLSQERADNVVAYLESKGVAAARLKAVGYGDTMPVAENTKADGSDNPEGRQQNRRIEFKILSK